VKSGLTKAFRQALRAAKMPGPRPGDTVDVVYTGDEAPTSAGLNPTKVYEVTYTRAS
jgi:hypothetical protein